MSETLSIETEDVYGAPLLAEAGDFADPQGEGVEISEGTHKYFGEF